MRSIGSNASQVRHDYRFKLDSATIQFGAGINPGNVIVGERDGALIVAISIGRLATMFCTRHCTATTSDVDRRGRYQRNDQSDGSLNAANASEGVVFTNGPTWTAADLLARP